MAGCASIKKTVRDFHFDPLAYTLQKIRKLDKIYEIAIFRH